MSKILKWPVPIDDKWHRIGNGPVVAVMSEPKHSDTYWRTPGAPCVLVYTVEWSESEARIDDEILKAAGARKKITEARVYGTGHDFPPHATYGGSCRDDYIMEKDRFVDGPFVWHVLTLTGHEAPDAV